jgi:SET domain-containing protein
MATKPHKIVYELLIIILLVLCTLLGYKVDNLQKINELKPKTKYYSPLDCRLIIKPSTIEGLGLFALEDIPVGETLGVSHIYDDNFKNKFMPTSLGGFINNSDNPNLQAYIDTDFRYIKTLRHIESGEELTLKYSLQ